MLGSGDKDLGLLKKEKCLQKWVAVKPDPVASENSGSDFFQNGK